MNNDTENKEWLKDYPALDGVAKGNPFVVPDGFFNASEEQILSSVNILSTIQSDTQAFSVPGNYFEDLQSNILSRVKIEEVLGKDHSFTVPDNYFTDMHEQITSRIAVEEAARAPFTVPEGYFETLNREILNQTAGLEAIQRRGVIRKLVSTAAFKYASAACFALIVGAGIIISQQNSPRALHDKTYLHKALSEVPNADIKGYLEMRVDANDANGKIDENSQSDLSNVSTDDMKDYLSSN
ncbi:hypothetical protein [Mucilaginibacter ginkgonis]|uniref:Uncharacterized protein n=1 Tax=Mucilaginibacter ginkgonis TaxID=2682091 RepID=A0A6I4I5N1_9SPHI|nr:hypothetical protein [Mucilaginibacter ginkgonis]QQL48501.1 hypothetical protein GO620_009890 [Mucilaginibacter ginkgonis]